MKAGMAEDAASFRWSGHRGIVGRRHNPLVAVDEVLSLYGASRRTALRAYRSAMANVAGEDWSDAAPGSLPWWRLGRPTEEERKLRWEAAPVDELGRPTGPWRRQFTAREWLDLACAHLEIKPEILCGRGRAKDVVRWRELVGLVGTERFGVKVKALATELGKSPDGVSQWYRRGVVRRREDAAFAAAAEALDRAASEAR